MPKVVDFEKQVPRVPQLDVMPQSLLAKGREGQTLVAHTDSHCACRLCSIAELATTRWTSLRCIPKPFHTRLVEN